MIQLMFPDKCVTYSTFINDLATALVPKLMEAMENPSDLISQNKAFKRPGKIEYRLSDLRILQQRKQDYFE